MATTSVEVRGGGNGGLDIPVVVTGMPGFGDDVNDLFWDIVSSNELSALSDPKIPRAAGFTTVKAAGVERLYPFDSAA